VSNLLCCSVPWMLVQKAFSQAPACESGCAGVINSHAHACAHDCRGGAEILYFIGLLISFLAQEDPACMPCGGPLSSEAATEKPQGGSASSALRASGKSDVFNSRLIFSLGVTLGL
jgi:hypothetical protein